MPHTLKKRGQTHSRYIWAHTHALRLSPPSFVFFCCCFFLARSRTYVHSITGMKHWNTLQTRHPLFFCAFTVALRRVLVPIIKQSYFKVILPLRTSIPLLFLRLVYLSTEAKYCNKIHIQFKKKKRKWKKKKNHNSFLSPQMHINNRTWSKNEGIWKLNK